MTKRAGFPVFFFCLIFALLLDAGCSGTRVHSVVLTPNTPQTISQGRTLPITATVSNDTSNAGVTWSLAPAMGAGTLGPTSKTATTYNAPVAVTVATSVTVTATSVTFPNRSATLSITVEPILGLLRANYAFEFSGSSSSGAVVAAGSFTADGAGKITNGVEDFNSIPGPPRNQTFTGTYTLGSDNRGTLVFSSLAGSETYAFAIDPTGAHGRLVRFDSSGIRGSGEIERQSISTCGTNNTLNGDTLNGDYAMGITGNSGPFPGFLPGPVVFAGRFTATPPAIQGGTGSLGNGEVDANTPGLVSLNPSTVSGTYQATSQPARCTATVSAANLMNPTFSVYPISATGGTLTEAFLVQIDAVSSTTPYLTAGKLFEQVGFPFSGPSSAFTATSVAGLSGQFLNPATKVYSPDVAIVQMTATGGNSFSMSVTENQAGSTGTFGSPISANFVNADSFGRVATNLTVPFAPVFYMIDQDEAFCVGETNNNPLFGIFEPQSAGPFHASTIKGTLLEGTSRPTAPAVEDFSGVVAFDGVSSITGTQDTSTSSANFPGQTVTGTYTNIVPASGLGTLTLTRPSPLTGNFFIVSPTKFVLISTTPGDSNPVLTIVGN
jgi:hypothetical protein